MKIDQIEISGFKSVADLKLRGLEPFSVFAGPNGSGKSNLMDALSFVSAVVEPGAVKALRQFRGFPQVHCYKLRRRNARTFGFSIRATLDGQALAYTLKVYDMDKAPQLDEVLTVNGKKILERKKGTDPLISSMNSDKSITIEKLPLDMSGLLFTQSEFRLYDYLTNVEVFRFDPMRAKEPDDSSADTTALDPYGRNVATMLAMLEKDDDFRTQVMEWMNLLVL